MTLFHTNEIHHAIIIIISPTQHYSSAASAMSRVLAVFVFAVLLVALVAARLIDNKPNIVFTLVDDWGFAEAGFRNPAVKTPTFDMLATTGLVLNRHYVFKYCSPSRVSFLTGRWPHHAHQYNIHPNFKVGANINMTMLPAKLKKAGYATHIVGKWHEGFYERKYLPVNRGFDTSSGFLSGAEGHFNQTLWLTSRYRDR